MTDRIDSQGYPLAFKVANGKASNSFQLNLTGNKLIKVEARQMYKHQKEAITTEGENGSLWRIPSDEGLHLHGTDLAPFPLGFFNAGIQGDLFHIIHQLASFEKVDIDSVHIQLSNHYWLTGSFILGTGEGHAEPTKVQIEVKSQAPKEVVEALVKKALNLSPAIQFLKADLKNSFALFINGRKKSLTGLKECSNENIQDPFLTYSQSPVPLNTKDNEELLKKLEIKELGEVKSAPNTINGKMLRNVLGKGVWQKGNSFAEIETWLEMPGTTHFSYKADVGGSGFAPSGLNLLSTGITFCFMTQLARYVEGMKMDIHGIRLVQLNPYVMDGNCGKALPIETYLYLNGNAPEEIHTKLLEIAERTCYLHASAATPLEPEVNIVVSTS